MKWLTPFLCLLAMSATAQEQEQEPVLFPILTECYTFEHVKDFLFDNYGELPIASGSIVVQAFTNAEFYDARQYIFVNSETYTWSTVVYFEEDDKACVVTMGSEFGPVIQETGI